MLSDLRIRAQPVKHRMRAALDVLVIVNDILHDLVVVRFVPESGEILVEKVTASLLRLLPRRQGRRGAGGCGCLATTRGAAHVPDLLTGIALTEGLDMPTACARSEFRLHLFNRSIPAVFVVAVWVVSLAYAFLNRDCGTAVTRSKFARGVAHLVCTLAH